MTAKLMITHSHPGRCPIPTLRHGFLVVTLWTVGFDESWSGTQEAVTTARTTIEVLADITMEEFDLLSKVMLSFAIITSVLIVITSRFMTRVIGQAMVLIT